MDISDNFHDENEAINMVDMATVANLVTVDYNGIMICDDCTAEHAVLKITFSRAELDEHGQTVGAIPLCSLNMQPISVVNLGKYLTGEVARLILDEPENLGVENCIMLMDDDETRAAVATIRRSREFMYAPLSIQAIREAMGRGGGFTGDIRDNDTPGPGQYM